MDISYARAQFPHLKNGIIHLNHAGISPLSLPVGSAIHEFVDRMTVDPIESSPWAWGRHIACHDAFARLMGVSPQDVAITKNTAHGISIIADGLKWEPGDEVIFADCEYPANTYPWMSQIDRRVMCKIVPTRPDGTIPVADYANLVGPRTRVIAVSWVQFATGYMADIAALARLAHANDALLVVDVIQGLGAAPLNLTAAQVDIAACGSQKWLIGPVGVGALYINPRVLDQLRLVNMGAGSVRNVAAFEPLAFDPKPNAQRYEEGTPNVPGTHGVLAAIEFLESFGIDRIRDRILATTRHAMQGLQNLGYELLSPTEDRDRSGIVLFRHPSLPNDQIIDALKAAKIHVVDRGGKVRFAPHFYNTEEDIDRALAALP